MNYLPCKIRMVNMELHSWEAQNSEKNGKNSFNVLIYNEKKKKNFYMNDFS